MLPIPASADWRMSASPIGRSPDAAIRRTASAESKPSASTSGPRRRSDSWRASCRAERSSTTGALKHTATASSVASTARARRAGFFHRSPGPYRCHDPVIRMCVKRARPSSKRTSRFFPRASTDSTMRPERSAPSSRGNGDAKEVIRFPCSVRPRARAARRIVSPSGIGFDLDRDRAREGTFEVAAAARLESRFAEEAGEGDRPGSSPSTRATRRTLRRPLATSDPRAPAIAASVSLRSGSDSGRNVRMFRSARESQATRRPS